jgi:hypothetical protein
LDDILYDLIEHSVVCQIGFRLAETYDAACLLGENSERFVLDGSNVGEKIEGFSQQEFLNIFICFYFREQLLYSIFLWELFN